MDAAVTLQEIFDDCGRADLSSSDLLDVPVEGYGEPPLTIETARCDFDGNVA